MGDGEFNEAGGNNSGVCERTRWSGAPSSSHLVPETSNSERKNIAVATRIIRRRRRRRTSMKANENLIIFFFIYVDHNCNCIFKILYPTKTLICCENSCLPVKFAAHRYSVLPYSIAFLFEMVEQRWNPWPACLFRSIPCFNLYTHNNGVYSKIFSVLIYIVACCALSSEDIFLLRAMLQLALYRLPAIFNFILFSLRRFDESYVACHIVSNQLRLPLLLLRSSMPGHGARLSHKQNTYYTFDEAFLLKHLPKNKWSPINGMAMCDL